MGNRPSGLRSAADVSLIALFLAALYLPLADAMLHIDGTSAPIEKRSLASVPEISLDAEAMTEFPQAFSAYYRDRFGFRNRLIRWHNRAMVRWLHTSPSARVVLGENGYCFYAGNNTIDYYRCLEPFSEAELARWLTVLEERQDWLAARGCRYLVVVAPNKHSIYPEYVPDKLNRVRGTSRLDQLLGYLRARSDVAFLDLREPLLGAKQDADVYARTDSHWNDLGAYFAYEAIAIRLGKWFPEVTPWPLSSYQINTRVGPGIDLAGLLGMEDVITDEYVSLVPLAPRLAKQVDPGYLLSLRDWGVTPPVVTQHPDARLPSAVMLRDSFSIRLIPFLSEHFSRIAYLWEYGFDTIAIEREQPAVVIHEFAERDLIQDWSVPTNPPVVRDELPQP